MPSQPYSLKPPPGVRLIMKLRALFNREKHMKFKRTLVTFLLMCGAFSSPLIQIMNKRLAAILLMALGVPALALAWTAGGLVNNVYSHNGTHIIDTTILDAPCGTAGRFWWSETYPDAKYMFALATTALVAQKQISVVHDPTTPNCLFGGQLATHMVITR